MPKTGVILLDGSAVASSGVRSLIYIQCSTSIRISTTLAQYHNSSFKSTDFPKMRQAPQNCVGRVDFWTHGCRFCNNTCMIRLQLLLLCSKTVFFNRCFVFVCSWAPGETNPTYACFCLQSCQPALDDVLYIFSLHKVKVHFRGVVDMKPGVL